MTTALSPRQRELIGLLALGLSRDECNCLHLWEPLDHRPTPDFRKAGTL